MHQHIERQLFDAGTIERRLEVLACEITERYRGRELTVIVVLNGSIFFAADLLRRIDLPLQLECVRASSYHGAASSSGVVEFPGGRLPNLKGRAVLVLDDILDTGRTLHALCERLAAESSPLSMEICVLLRKQKVRAETVEAQYAGFEIGDEFVVGYGLDYQGRYRNLPFIATLQEEVLARTEP